MALLRNCNPCARNGLQDDCQRYLRRMSNTLNLSKTTQNQDSCEDCSPCIEDLFRMPEWNITPDPKKCPGHHRCTGKPNCPGCRGPADCNVCNTGTGNVNKTCPGRYICSGGNCPGCRGSTDCNACSTGPGNGKRCPGPGCWGGNCPGCRGSTDCNACSTGPGNGKRCPGPGCWGGNCPGCRGSTDCKACSGSGGNGSGNGNLTDKMSDFDPVMLPYNTLFYPLGPCGPKFDLCPYVALGIFSKNPPQAVSNRFKPSSRRGKVVRRPRKSEKL